MANVKIETDSSQAVKSIKEGPVPNCPNGTIIEDAKHIRFDFGLIVQSST